MKLINIFLVLAIVSMLLVAGCSKSAPTVESDAGADVAADDSAAAPTTPEGQTEVAIDSTLVAEDDNVELGSLI